MKKKVVSYSVDYLQILDEAGKIDKKLEPKLPKATLLSMYSAMVKARLLDEKSFKLQRQGRMGTFAPVTGQEAAQVGSCFALDSKDWMVPSFRESAAAICRGASIKEIALYTMGYPQGGKLEPGGTNMQVSVPVGSQTLHATGIGMAMNILKKKQVALVYFGDGATSEGDVSEAMNFAGVYNTPVIFLCQNNQWAISLPRSEQTKSETIAQKAGAFGISGIQVDGNDVLAMYVATSDAVKKARAGKGATLIEAVTYRILMHTTADDPTKYRSSKEVEAWKKKDPIDRFRKYLEKKKLWNATKEKKLRETLQAEIDEQLTSAEQEVAKVEDMFQYTYDKMTPQLDEQLKVAKKYFGGK